MWQVCDCIDRAHPCGEAGNIDDVDLATVQAGPVFEALRSRTFRKRRRATPALGMHCAEARASPTEAI
ncbi:hypothetical protein [Luteimonas chenhongjianii]|uniref:hypothetical protein n=1 Tax=Luteimonas chenhongjianii TaxID=2006110 RepID=UPI003CCBBCE3